jgi:hypothetical protein
MIAILVNISKSTSPLVDSFTFVTLIGNGMSYFLKHGPFQKLEYPRLGFLKHKKHDGLSLLKHHEGWKLMYNMWNMLHFIWNVIWNIHIEHNHITFHQVFNFLVVNIMLFELNLFWVFFNIKYVWLILQI